MYRLYKIMKALLIMLFLSGVVVSCTNGSTNASQNPTVPIKNHPLITSYFLNQIPGTINKKEITVTLPFNTNLESLVATFTTTGASTTTVNGDVQISGITPNNFTNPVIYEVASADGVIESYTVTVNVLPSSNKSIISYILDFDNVGLINGESIVVQIQSGTSFESLVASFVTTGESLVINGIKQISGITPNNFTSPIIYTVYAKDGSTSNYTVAIESVEYSPERTSQWDMLDNSTYSIKADKRVWAITRGNPNLYVGVVDAGSCNSPGLESSFIGGYDFVTNESNPIVLNGSQHGCAVAGIIAMHRNNISNVVGVAPNVKIVALNPFGTHAQATFSDIADAIEWGIGNPVPRLAESVNPYPVKIISMSLGTEVQGGPFESCDQVVQVALDDAYNKNIPVVVSAGNENTDASNRVMARCNHVIPVAATTENGVRVSYSNYGSIVHIAAPADPTYPSTSGSSYGEFGATSGAAPHVTGVLALMLSINPNLTISQMQNIIEQTATPFSSIQSPAIGSGIINALAAVDAVINLTKKGKIGAKTNEIVK